MFTQLPHPVHQVWEMRANIRHSAFQPIAMCGCVRFALLPGIFSVRFRSTILCYSEKLPNPMRQGSGGEGMYKEVYDAGIFCSGVTFTSSSSSPLYEMMYCCWRKSFPFSQRQPKPDRPYGVHTHTICSKIFYEFEVALCVCCIAARKSRDKRDGGG